MHVLLLGLTTVIHYYHVAVKAPWKAFIQNAVAKVDVLAAFTFKLESL